MDPDSGSESDSGHPAIDAHDTAKAAAKRAYCEALLYRDYLYKQLCVGLLQNYQDLIKRLRTNTFHDAVTAEGAGNTVGAALNIPQRRMNNREMFTSLTEVENESESSDDEAGGGRASKAPFCLGQAVEEYNYLKVRNGSCVFCVFFLQFNHDHGLMIKLSSKCVIGKLSSPFSLYYL